MRHRNYETQYLEPGTEGDAFQRDGVDPDPRNQFQEAHRLPREQLITQRRPGETLLERLPHGRRHLRKPQARQARVDHRIDVVVERQLQGFLPVDRTGENGAGLGRNVGPGRRSGEQEKKTFFGLQHGRKGDAGSFQLRIR